MSRAPLPLLTVASALGALAPGAARADMEEWQLALGGDYRSLVLAGSPDDVTVHAPGIAAGCWYGVDDYWQLGGSLQAGVGIPVPSASADLGAVASVAFEARYVLDIVEWVPHATAAVGALYDGVGARVDLTVGLGGGIDYRPDRGWGLGVDFRYDFVLTDLTGVGTAFHAALTYSSYFE